MAWSLKSLGVAMTKAQQSAFPQHLSGSHRWYLHKAKPQILYGLTRYTSVSERQTQTQTQTRPLFGRLYNLLNEVELSNYFLNFCRFTAQQFFYKFGFVIISNSLHTFVEKRFLMVYWLLFSFTFKAGCVANISYLLSIS